MKTIQPSGILTFFLVCASAFCLAVAQGGTGGTTGQASGSGAQNSQGNPGGTGGTPGAQAQPDSNAGASSSQGQMGSAMDQATATGQAASQSASQADQQVRKTGKKRSGEVTLSGCLSGPNEEGAYELHRGTKKVEVGGNDDLSKHVGHSVKLHGMWAKSGSEIGEKENAENGEAKGAKEEKGERRLKVTSIDQVSDTCVTSGEMSGHHHKKASSSEKPKAAPSSAPPKL